MLTRESILELKVADLKTELTKLGLDTKGLKADLQERLLATLEPSAGAGAGAASAGGDPAIAPSAAAAPAAAAPVAVPTGAVDMYAAAAAAAQQAALAQAPAVVAPSTTQPSDLGTSQQHQANDANDAASAADAHTAAVPSHNAGLENSAYAQQNAYAPEHAQEVVQPVDAYQAQQFDQQPVVPMESESRDKEHSSDRDRDRSDRSDRDGHHRSDRDRDYDRHSSRDRDRSDRDRSDRDRSDRDRSDRDRSDRDRSDRDRDRSDRDRDRDRSDRDRDYDRHSSRRDYDRSDRDRGDRRDSDHRSDFRRDDRGRGRSQPSRRYGSNLDDRPRRQRTVPSKYWDKPPPGFENSTPLQYKAMLVAQQIGTGGPSHFDHRGGGNLPPPSAAPPQQSGYIHPSRMGIVQHSGGTGGQAGSGNYGSGGSGGYTSGFGGGYASSSSGSNSYNSNNRQSRRLYIGGIVPGTPDVLIVDFLNREMNQRGMTSSPGNPVLAIQMTPDKNFAFLDMRTSEEATMCIALDGIPFEGTVFRIKRPKEYEGREANDPPSLFGMPSSSGGGFSSQGGAQGGSFGGSMGNDNPNKIYIGGLPFSLDEQQIRELLQTFGVIRNFSLVREGNGQSKGFAFLEYADPNVTDMAITGLHGMQLGDRQLVVQRAGVGRIQRGGQQPPPSMPYGAPSSFGAAPITPMQATPVVQLLNMVTPEELMDPEEYQDIVDDIREECSKYGEVVSVAIPRPVPGREVSGVGKVYVEFSNVDHAYQALQALSGRKFASRIVVTSFYGLDAYRRSEF